MDTKVLNQQSQHWEKNFSNKPEMFGLEPSISAKKALNFFKEKKINNIIELGAGLGRDSIFFAKNNIKIQALDYSSSGIEIINHKIKKNNLSHLITAEIFDIRDTFKINNKFFDACYSHMLYCMALSTSDLIKINAEINRVLKPGGLNIYTVRNDIDGDYKNGIHRGEDMYEANGFIVHFFTKDKINSLLSGFDNLILEQFDEGNFPRKLYFVVNKKNN